MTKHTDNETLDYTLIKRHRKRLRITQDELASWMGLQRMSIVRYERGEPIPPESKKKLLYFLNTETQEELYGNPTDDYGMEYQKLSGGNYILKIPFTPVCQYSYLLDTFDLGDTQISIVFDRINSGAYAAFEVRGEAMDDNSRYSLSNGDIAISKEVKIEDLSEEINPKDFWVILIENDILIRKIKGYNQNENSIVFKANNPSIEYADFSLNVSDIKRIYQVTQRITKFLN
ncbi:hypothetical protein CLV62_104178 [Dysgonomonas alginatilytica]|uniref:HTH cro/C1-type domain-containing protein n=1 Tax=Dysgonomonas alginatilytica TaxID=1605892 RepID=A0A2V3PRA4_9BACT|nr:hypothetical protein [Dysgonomonas alginatilytica]PXV66917.1 hypothetical protein CLV62_104178 [Dysgonomonas alginatilytica]